MRHQYFLFKILIGMFAVYALFSTFKIHHAKELQVTLFDEMAYQRVLSLKGIDDSLCSLVTGLRPNYVVCKYNPREDWISHKIAMSKSYEPKMSQRFFEMVKESGVEAVFVDLGVMSGRNRNFTILPKPNIRPTQNA